MIITLTNPKEMIVDQENKGKCKDPRCSNKTLFWAKVIATGSKCLISLQSDGTWWQHYKDCPSANTFHRETQRITKNSNENKKRTNRLRI